MYLYPVLRSEKKNGIKYGIWDRIQDPIRFHPYLLEYVFRPMWLRPMWPMYGTYIATLLGLALIEKKPNSSMVSAA
jgi:hypothetical protein